MKTFLTPGPSQLYFTYDFHLKNALKNHIGSISHRSSEFKRIYESTVENLRTLLNVPSEFEIVFTSSATEIWERIIQNEVNTKSAHFVNGAFSAKFSTISSELGRVVQVISGPENDGFDLSSIDVEEDAELIAITHNETSMGSSFPIDDIAKLRSDYPEKLIAVDCVSSAPYPEFDFSQFDNLYFSVQKCFGLPSGLGVWIVNDRSVEKSNKIKAEKSIGSYHSLPKLVEMGQKNQTPETPNVMNIYLLGKVAEDMLNKGIDMIRRETNYKYALLNQMVQSHQDLDPFIVNEKFRSKTVYVAKSSKTEKILEELSMKGIVIGSGYGKYKSEHIRIANFPTISKERMEMTVDLFESLEL